MTALSVVVLELATPEYRRVLDDARCSYLEASGAASVLVGGMRHELVPAELLAGAASQALAAARGDPGRPRALLDLRPRTPGDRRAGVPGDLREVGFLADPIEMLWWLMGVHEARHVHSTLNAYLYSSDPDDILPFLPYHPVRDPAPLSGSTAIEEVALATVVFGRATARRGGSVELELIAAPEDRASGPRPPGGVLDPRRTAR